jgi:hypothetical protein
MLKAIFEGELAVHFNAPSADLEAGILVKLNGSAVAVATGGATGDDVYGILAQPVRARNVNNFKLDSVTHVAYYGEKVGVYYGGGVYITDQTLDGTIAVGQKLYVGTGGKLTKTAPTGGNTKHVAIAETAGTLAGDKIRIRLVGNIQN